MIVFTVIGMIVCALAALCLVAGVVLALMSGRVKIGQFTPETSFRHYQVIAPGDGPAKTLGCCWTFWGAKRVARRNRGSRIFNRWGFSYVVVRGDWSETENGYDPPRDSYWAYD